MKTPLLVAVILTVGGVMWALKHAAIGWLQDRDRPGKWFYE